MTNLQNAPSGSVLLMIAGVKGAVGSTVAAAVGALKNNPELILPSLTTRNRFSHLGSLQNIHLAGWDIESESLVDCIKTHAVLPETIWQPFQHYLDHIPIQASPSGSNLNDQIDQLMHDMQTFKKSYGDAAAVLINLLPACVQMNLDRFDNLSHLISETDPSIFPDIAYVLAAIQSGIPLVNFTPNFFEVPLIVAAAIEHNVPIAGYDGKTGQTYLKVVLASALKARKLHVDGWYSLNILGNADGKNLLDPEKAAGKVANKTNLLDDILGYTVGQQYNTASHKVHIDYYPPRGDAKEAWDVIDFQGMFNLPMSLRLNFLGRDSILAAPMILDLARWMATLKMAGRSGLISELAFFFKKPLGEKPPLSFQDQVNRLRNLEKACEERLMKSSKQ